jgi:O-methyltransferase involved in polyketide biosynthesis
LGLPLGARLACECLHRAGRDDLVRLATTRPGRAAARLIEGVLLPGLSRHFVTRKDVIEEQARAALARGASGALVLGAGYDGLGATLAREGVPVTELDQEATQAVKREALAALSIRGVEFRPFTPASIERHARGRVVIAEGLLMYLPRDQALSTVAAAARGGAVRLVATFMERGTGQEPGFAGTGPLARRWLRRRGEPMRWWAGREEFAGELAGAGWRVTAMIGSAELRARYTAGARRARARLARGEVIAIGEPTEP